MLYRAMVAFWWILFFGMLGWFWADVMKARTHQERCQQVNGEVVVLYGGVRLCMPPHWEEQNIVFKGEK